MGQSEMARLVALLLGLSLALLASASMPKTLEEGSGLKVRKGGELTRIVRHADPGNSKAKKKKIKRSKKKKSKKGKSVSSKKSTKKTIDKKGKKVKKKSKKNKEKSNKNNKTEKTKKNKTKEGDRNR